MINNLDLLSVLNELANAQKTTKKEVIKKALATEAYLRSEVENGGEIFVYQRDKTIVKLVFVD